MSAALTDPSDRKAFSAYREMHRRAAGRSTRPPRTWELMENWLADGTGLLFGARLASQWVGFSYVLVSGRSAYYASAANHPDVEGQPIGHVLQWAAVEELARRGVVSYELGQQQFAPTSARAPSPKELAIARFKRGFGGQTVPVVEHERFWGRVGSCVGSDASGRRVRCDTQNRGLTRLRESGALRRFCPLFDSMTVGCGPA